MSANKKGPTHVDIFFLPVVDVVAAVAALIQLAFGLCSSFVEQA